jgi:riboflavin kinase/FMN adenylyltransferase
LKTFYEATAGLVQNSAMALGFFDGVHVGHQAVISTAVSEAKKRGLIAAVVTFKDHPRTLIQGAPPLVLTSIDDRLILLEELGIEVVLALSFTEELCRLTPRQYVQNILVDSMGAKLISVGHNHHFGRDREGNPELLARLGEEMDFAVKVAPPVFLEGIEVSSSRIRQAIFEGDMELANKFLSRPYAISAFVVKGASRGRSIGFPTANLAIEEFQVVPKSGVYIGTVHLGKERFLPCVINIGVRPTFDKPGTAVPDTISSHAMTVEVHILQFNEDIYDRKLTVSFHKFLRPEQKFPSVSALQEQISADCQKASLYFQIDRKSTSEPEQKLPA